MRRPGQICRGGLINEEKNRYFHGRCAWIYRISKAIRAYPPLEGNKYVIVSATIALFSGHETLIFAADKNGAIKNWTDLPGSFRGGLDHEQALKNAGYKL